jgi:site-specific recombinase XerD
MKIVEIYIKKLTNLNYSERTIDTYSCYLEKALTQLDENPYHISTKTIEDYLLNKKYSSVSQQNQIIGSLKLFAKHILNKKDIHLNKIKRPRKERKLPRVVDKNVLITKINIIENIKHKAMLSLLYGTGIRASEILNIKISDIDSNRMLILIRNSKFNKDRYVPFSKNNLELLRLYFKKYRPKEFLFEGTNNKYSYSSLKNISVNNLGVTPHILRHSYATALVENKTNLRVIQTILGHNSSKTTEIYTHVSQETFETVELPN